MSTNESWIHDSIRRREIRLFSYVDFTDLEHIAKGGLAEILFARHLVHSNREVIIKKLINYDTQKLAQEVKMHNLCSGRSNYVVDFFGLAKEIDRFMMVMEYANHLSLRNFLSKENIDWQTKYKLSIDIVKGLHHLHSCSVIHRDLHTENIVINKRDQSNFMAQITDFGEAISTNEVFNNDYGFCVPEFTDPNYLNSKTEKRNEKSDIYSLGVIFWEISSGKKPFDNFMRGSQNRTLYLSLKIINGEREKVSGSTPQTYSLLYSTCWHKNQLKRPTLEQIINILGRINDISANDVRNVLNINDSNESSESGESDES